MAQLVTTHEAFQSAVRENVMQFHTRLKNEVAKITCDLKAADPSSLDEASLRTLVTVLQGELQQVVDAVNTAKF